MKEARDYRDDITVQVIHFKRGYIEDMARNREGRNEG